MNNFTSSNSNFNSSNSSNSSNSNFYSSNSILIEYIYLTRLQQENMGNIINAYSRSQVSLNNNVRMLMQQNLNSENNYINNIMNFAPTTTRNISSRPLTPIRSTRSRIFPQSRTTRNRPSRNTVREIYRQNLSYLPVSSSTLSPSTNQSNNELLNNTLQQSLYTPSLQTPISNIDISNNTTIRLRNEISSSQEICPISLERFLPNDRVMQINSCGHIFLERSLRTFLQVYDNRCPLCRRSINSLQTNNTNTVRSNFQHHDISLNLDNSSNNINALEIPRTIAPA